MNRCGVCKESSKKPTCNSCYGKEWRRKNSEHCKAYQKKYCAENREAIRVSARKYTRKWRLKTKYGVTTEWFDQVFERQNNSCAICLRKFKPNQTICVDHHHETGQARGLLCKNCNTGIGMLEESPENLFSAFNYLEDHKLGIKR